MIVAETARLIVRRLRADDLDDFAALCGNAEISRYMDAGEPLTREQSGQWLDITLNNYEVRGWGNFGITLKEDDRLIGFGGFARPPERPGIVEIIYAFDPLHWGKGYATEAGRAIVEFGFASCGMTRIEATVDPANDASTRVVEKIGMTYVGKLEHSDGGVSDLFAIERLTTPGNS